MSSLAAIASLVEPRAKRTHARRSCDLCKVRKTRCELPDLDVPSGPDPLPFEQTCHRCRVLALPCIVDDSSRKVAKRSREPVEPSAQPHLGPLLLPPAPKRQADTTALRKQAKQAKSHAVNHSLNLMQGFQPVEPSSDSPIPSDFAFPSRNPELYFSPGGQTETHQVRSLKLHGRPLELVCAMLEVAYKKNPPARKAFVEFGDVELNEVLDQKMLAVLEPGVNQLKTYHPYLPTLASLLSLYNSTPIVGTTFLLSTVAYIASVPAVTTAAVIKLRATLGPYITHLRDFVMLSIPASTHALQALEILIIHAPLGVLPLQMASPGSLAVARGQLSVAMNIYDALNFSLFLKHLFRAGPEHVWFVSDLWLWASLVADEASIALEDELCKKPANLTEIHDLLEPLMSGECHHLWHTMTSQDSAETIGRLQTCDRLSRLNVMHDALSRLRGSLETAAQDRQFDPIDVIAEEMKYFLSQMEAINQRHDLVLGECLRRDPLTSSAIITPISMGIESGCLSYRRLKRCNEATKVLVAGLRYIMATGYLAGSATALINLVDDVNPAQKVSYAIARATNPADMMSYIMQGPATRGVRAIWEWGRTRGDFEEQTLNIMAELGPSLLPDLQGKRADLVPLHSTLAAVVSAAKVLMEMHAASMLIVREGKYEHSAPRTPPWFFVMKQVCQEIRAVGTLSQGDEGGESIENGCSNLIGSMIRVTDEWAKVIEKEGMERLQKDPQENQASGHPFRQGATAI